MFILKNNLTLILSLTKRDIESRYKSSILGLAWSIVFPLFMLIIYTFVFGFVFKSKWNVDSHTTSINYSLMMFTGLILHSVFSDCIGRSTTLIQSNTNYVKKVIFPLESLCWVSLLSSYFQFIISFIVLMIFVFIEQLSFHFTILLVPVLIIPFIILSYSLVLIISSLSVYIRDVSQMVPILISVLLFMSPVFYGINAVPEKYQWLIYINPLTYIIESMRDIILFGRVFSIEGYTIYLAISLFLYFVASKWFNKLKLGFSDVL
ncbi:ABC transporter permease [Photobacterium carnosum]|uniref:ABC transporter permease n=1 Tax=Photobacterium carnosum TaxID=2023717 RepID=UPI001F3DB638|nr:ABC transporter permease [Photobacterium carnosum]MCF2155747.1 ABC transporter permease [Photobacterium carnosum]MCF2217572.1 ABC transporter permease [Photobacterium carnosum]